MTTFRAVGDGDLSPPPLLLLPRAVRYTHADEEDVSDNSSPGPREIEVSSRRKMCNADLRSEDVRRGCSWELSVAHCSRTYRLRPNTVQEMGQSRDFVRRRHWWYVGMFIMRVKKCATMISAEFRATITRLARALREEQR